MSAQRSLAPAKINLGLFLGPRRASDGRHEIVTVMQSISLADELTLAPAPAGAARDQVSCPGVPGDGEDNLAAAALRAFRGSTGWDGSPRLLSIVKRIPVAAGLGGGSADAAAALRLAALASGLGDPAQLLGLATALGADVPAQLDPGRWLATGAGEELQRLPPPRSELGVLVLPAAAQLATAAVYAEADRLGLQRPRRVLRRRAAELAAALAHGATLPDIRELLHNDLQQAAMSLCPDIAGHLRLAHEAGAEVALVSGSGPTVLGLFGAACGGLAAAERAAATLRQAVPGASSATPARGEEARALTLA
jgi:4-diphosphocytidyl-2-C-methyl-D-erythritol kinase